MATLYREGGNGSWSIRFVDENGIRRSVCLGKKFSKKTAVEAKQTIEALMDARNNSQQPDKRVVVWLETATAEIRAKFAKVGLIQQVTIVTLGGLWDAFEAEDRGIKERTKENYRTVRKSFFAFFRPDDPISRLTKEAILEWKRYLESKYETATVSNAIVKTKCLLNWATDEKELFAKSPGKGIRKGSFVNKNKDFTIEMPLFEKLLEQCRTQEQRTLLTLARIGGLRIPSEIAGLTWADVQWDKDTFFIKSPKTERHGKDGRFVPLWEPIRRELQALRAESEYTAKNDPVFPGRNGNSNFRTRIEAIQKRAGIPLIPRFFDNCRASRSMEVFDKYGAFRESEWIGHSNGVAMQHYFKMKNSDYSDAVEDERFEEENPMDSPNPE